MKKPHRRVAVGSNWRVLAQTSRGSRVEHRSVGETIFDELVVNDLGLHIEQMSDRHWWAQIGDAYCGITVERDGKVRFDVRRGEYGPILGRTEAPLSDAERAAVMGKARRR